MFADAADQLLRSSLPGLRFRISIDGTERHKSRAHLSTELPMLAPCEWTGRGLASAIVKQGKDRLIERGNLLGAWAVAEPLHADEVERRWTQIVEWLACFAASLPIPEGCDIALLTHCRMAVRAALRVELALRAGDIPRAVHGSVAFFEAALWDKLGEKVSRHATKRQFRFHAPPDDDLVRERDPAILASLSKNKQGKHRGRPFVFKESADGSDWYWIDDNEICAIEIAKHYLHLQSLTTFGQAVGGDVRDLRNDVAHNEPSPALMNDARRRMQAASLWSSDDTFLSQRPVQAVLQELGESDPSTLLRRLLVDVRRRLVTPDSASSPPATLFDDSE